jgi:DNA invertase Pin-like site-specific DNA recombinase
MIYAYLRVSSTDQNLDRQLEAVKNYRPELEDENIFADKQTGKNFEREEYQKLKSILKKGDELIIKELDRLGRNKDAVKDEMKWFKDNGVTVRILDVPSTLIDFQGQDWIADMVNNIIIEVLAAMAEQERIKIKKRQKEGIAIAKAKGVRFGRPKKELPEFEKFLKKQKEGLISITQACNELGISRTQWYRLINDVV